MSQSSLEQVTTRNVQWKPQKNTVPPYKCLGFYVHINRSSRTSFWFLAIPYPTDGPVLSPDVATSQLLQEVRRVLVATKMVQKRKNCASIRERIYSGELSQVFLLAGIPFRLSSAVSCVSGVNLEVIHSIYVVRELPMVFPPFQTWKLTITSMESLTKDLLPSSSHLR